MRMILAVISGAVVGSLIFFGFGFIANLISPTPPELMDPATPEAVELRVAFTSTATWLLTMFGLAVGAFAGGAVAAGIDKTSRILAASLTGSFLSLWALYTFYVVFPAVLWVPAGMLISALLFSYLGGTAVRRLKQS